MRSLLLGSALLSLPLLVTAARTAPYELPEEALAALPPGPGSELTAANCSACHSLDYVTTQPRGKGAQFWKDSVAKMITVYGAPLSKEDAETISTYLGATYGS